MKPIVNYPVLCFLNGKLAVHTQKSFGALGASFSDQQTFLTLENMHIKGQDGWLLDAKGLYTTLKYTGSTREWARPLSFLWNAVQSKYQFTEHGLITVGALLKTMEGMSNSSLGEIGKDLDAFLTRYEPETIVTADVLSRWPI